MATYFDENTEMQQNGDALQTLILMNPAYVGYSDHQHHMPPPVSNFTFLTNSTSSATASQLHHFAGIPLQAAAASSPQHQDVSLLGGSLPRFHYNPIIDGRAAREVTRPKQGLSLSLFSQQPAGPAPSQAPETAAEVKVLGGTLDNVVLSCKYLKVAQQLLDEVVNVGKEAKNGRELSKGDNGNSKNDAAAVATAADGGGKGGAELTTTEKQEIQMKKAKLVDMLDEVEQRYKQYEQRMQMVIRWFEEAGGGVGSAKTYTALALQTISKQFRCLKDAIMAQIGAAATNLGEDEENINVKGSRLKYIDNQIRQQQFCAWRPQRGLPERSVSVLRAWLFQHFLHPYPKDTDKIMLAKQAGLTRSQVSNWFINARVRLWKPMVEEMYAEEIKGQQRSGSSTDNETAKTSEEKQVISPSNISSQDEKNTISKSTTAKNTQGMRSPKKPRITAEISHDPPPTIMQWELSDASMRFRYDERLQSREGFTISGGASLANNFYPLVEQFQPPYSSNGVSLTLGLQHCENISSQSRSSTVENDFGSLNAHDRTTSSGVHDSIDVQNSERFAPQLLPDFVT